MILDEMHEEGQHMMDWGTWGFINWILMIIGWIVFFLIVIVLLYFLSRETRQIVVHDIKQVQTKKNLEYTNNTAENIRKKAYFCPNCGEKLDKRTQKYCKRCGSEI